MESEKLRRSLKVFHGAIHGIGLWSVFYPLFVAIFAFVLPLPVFTAMALAAAFSGALSVVVFKKLFVSKRGPHPFTLIMAFSFCCFYLGKVCALIYDAVFPTGLIGMIVQIVGGRYPASFIAFPEVPANYHQGFVTLAASLDLLTGMPIPAAMQLTILVGVFCFILWAAELMEQSQVGLTIWTLGLLLVASFPIVPDWFQAKGALDFVEYVTWGDILLSTSFAWGMPAFLLFFLLQHNLKPSLQKSALIGWVLVALSMFHATLYSIGLLVFFFCIFLERDWGNKETRVDFSFWGSLFILLGVWWAPQFLPTAFLSGEAYEKVQVGLRWPHFENAKQGLYYLRLSGAVLLVGLYVLLQPGVIRRHRILCVGALVTFFFPIVFELKNVNIWDNFHKFAVLNQFFCLLLLAVSWGGALRGQRLLALLLAVTVISSMPAVKDALNYRFNKTPVIYFGFQKDTPEVAFLKSIPGDVMLYGFKHNAYTHDLLSETANYAGAFSRTSYYDNFLLSRSLEDDYHAVENWSTDPKAFRDVLENRLKDKNTFIAVETKDLAEFKTRAEEHSLKNLVYTPFEQWVFVSYKK